MWTTEIKAIVDGKVKTFCGPNIEAPSKGLARQYCQLNGLGYCKVTDQLISEIPVKDGGVNWDKRKDYDYELN
jgi:hypothetical protein